MSNDYSGSIHGNIFHVGDEKCAVGQALTECQYSVSLSPEDFDRDDDEVEGT
jgi:hypothetical protein